MSAGSASLRMDSSREGMTPSLLNPMSTSTSSRSILTTVPSTRSPSSKSVSVPSISAFIWSSETSSKSMTDVFLISVKTDPFQKTVGTPCRRLSANNASTPSLRAAALGPGVSRGPTFPYLHKAFPYKPN